MPTEKMTERSDTPSGLLAKILESCVELRAMFDDGAVREITIPEEVGLIVSALRSETAPLVDALNAIIVRADQRMGSKVSDDVVAIARAALKNAAPQGTGREQSHAGRDAKVDLATAPAESASSSRCVEVPSKDELQWAREIVKAYDANDGIYTIKSGTVAHALLRCYD